MHNLILRIQVQLQERYFRCFLLCCRGFFVKAAAFALKHNLTNFLLIFVLHQ